MNDLLNDLRAIYNAIETADATTVATWKKMVGKEDIPLKGEIRDLMVEMGNVKEMLLYLIGLAVVGKEG